MNLTWSTNPAKPLSLFLPEQVKVHYPNKDEAISNDIPSSIFPPHRGI